VKIERVRKNKVEGVEGKGREKIRNGEIREI